MVFRTRKAATIGGILVVAIGWIIKAPMLAHWANTGLISAISFLLLFGASASLLVGALMVQLGKRARLPFVLHIIFAVLAFLSSHSLRFIFSIPLAIGVLVAATAIFWPATTQRRQALTGPAQGPSN
jgi:hypothetical protein